MKNRLATHPPRKYLLDPLTFGSPRSWIRTSWACLPLYVALSFEKRPSHLEQLTASAGVEVFEAKFVLAAVAATATVDPSEMPQLLLSPPNGHTEIKPKEPNKNKTSEIDVTRTRDRDRQCTFSGGGPRFGVITTLVS